MSDSDLVYEKLSEKDLKALKELPRELPVLFKEFKKLLLQDQQKLSPHLYDYIDCSNLANSERLLTLKDCIIYALHANQPQGEVNNNKEYKVATFNIGGDKADPRQLCLDQNLDILCIQEANKNFDIDIQGYQCVTQPYKMGMTEKHFAICYKTEAFEPLDGESYIDNVSPVLLDAYDSGDYLEPYLYKLDNNEKLRLFTMPLVCKSTKRIYLVATVHIANKFKKKDKETPEAPETPSQKRSELIKRILFRVLHLAECMGLTIILGGDFNTDNSSVIHGFTKFLKPTIDGTVKTTKTRFARSIDNVFVSMGFSTTHVSLPEKYGSDHFPIVATIKSCDEQYGEDKIPVDFKEFQKLRSNPYCSYELDMKGKIKNASEVLTQNNEIEGEIQKGDIVSWKGKECEVISCGTRLTVRAIGTESKHWPLRNRVTFVRRGSSGTQGQ